MLWLHESTYVFVVRGNSRVQGFTTIGKLCIHSKGMLGVGLRRAGRGALSKRDACTKLIHLRELRLVDVESLRWSLCFQKHAGQGRCTFKSTQDRVVVLSKARRSLYFQKYAGSLCFQKHAGSMCFQKHAKHASKQACDYCEALSTHNDMRSRSRS